MDKFEKFASEFELMIKSAKITGETEVSLTYDWADTDNRVVATTKTPLTTLVKVEGGSVGMMKELAASMYEQTVIANMRSMIGSAPRTPVLMPGIWPTPIYVRNFGYEIMNP